MAAVSSFCDNDRCTYRHLYRLSGSWCSVDACSSVATLHHAPSAVMVAAQAAGVAVRDGAA